MLSSLKHLCPNHFRLFRYSRLMKQCLKRFRIRSFSGPYFTAFGLNTDLKHSKYGHFSSKGFRYFCWGPLDKGWFPLQDFLYIQSVKSARSVLNPEVKAHALPPLEENNKERKINTHIAHILIIFSDWVFLLRKNAKWKTWASWKKRGKQKKKKKGDLLDHFFEIFSSPIPLGNIFLTHNKCFFLEEFWFAYMEAATKS